MADSVPELGPVLAKICSSSMFRQSKRLQRFLTYATKWAVEHPDQPLKEYSIAIGVYDKSASFDAQMDPIVRVEANRLRSRLVEYYAGPGRDDPWIIDFPKGTYTPTIRTREAEQPRGHEAGSIAVIPSIDGAGSELQYLADGIAEGITRRLTQVQDLRVSPWEMILDMRKRGESVTRMADQLRVSTILVIRLVVRPDELEVHAEWIDSRRAALLWAARYEREIGEVYDLEDEIALDLVQHVAPDLTQPQLAEIRKLGTASGRAYEHYLKGRHLWNKRTVDSLKKAIRHYQRAIDDDPRFALAFGGIADCYLILGTFTFVAPRASFPRAKSAANRALELDPTFGETRATIACARAVYDWDWPQAELDFQQSIALAPKYPVARQWYGATLCARGRFASGRKQLKTALELDPLSPMIGTQLGVGYYLERRYGDAIRACEDVQDLDPHFWAAWHFLGLCHQALGRTDQAIANLRRAAELSGETPFVCVSLGHALAHSGNEKDAEKILSVLKSRSASEYVPPYALALISCGLSRRHEALSYLEDAEAERSPAIALWLRGEWRLDSLRSEPRFQRILQNAGLA